MESSVFLFRHECANFYIKSCCILLAATVLNGEMCIWTIFFPYKKVCFSFMFRKLYTVTSMWCWHVTLFLNVFCLDSQLYLLVTKESVAARQTNVNFLFIQDQSQMILMSFWTFRQFRINVPNGLLHFSILVKQNLSPGEIINKVPACFTRP